MKQLIVLAAIPFLAFTAATNQLPGKTHNGSQALYRQVQCITDSINQLLLANTSYKPQISVSMRGTVIITTGNMQFFTFHISELVQQTDSEGIDVRGIEMVACDTNKVAANNWIRFNTERGTVAFIKFECIDEAALSRIHQLIIQLRTTLTTPIC